jgi:hypothetical protein
MKFKKIIFVVLPFLAPVLAYFIYDPINTNWTVKKFGCGCPSIDGTYGFDANDFNMILWFLILSLCVGFWYFQTKKVTSYKFLIGLILILIICIKCFASGFWL